MYDHHITYIFMHITKKNKEVLICSISQVTNCHLNTYDTYIQTCIHATLHFFHISMRHSLAFRVDIMITVYYHINIQQTNIEIIIIFVERALHVNKYLSSTRGSAHQLIICTRLARFILIYLFVFD